MRIRHAHVCMLNIAFRNLPLPYLFPIYRPQASALFFIAQRLTRCPSDCAELSRKLVARKFWHQVYDQHLASLPYHFVAITQTIPILAKHDADA